MLRSFFCIESVKIQRKVNNFDFCKENLFRQNIIPKKKKLEIPYFFTNFIHLDDFLLHYNSVSACTFKYEIFMTFK